MFCRQLVEHKQAHPSHEQWCSGLENLHIKSNISSNLTAKNMHPIYTTKQKIKFGSIWLLFSNVFNKRSSLLYVCITEKLSSSVTRSKIFNIISIWLSATWQHNCRHCLSVQVLKEAMSRNIRDILEGYLWRIEKQGG